MLEALDLLDLRFSHLNHDNLGDRGGGIADLLMVHPVFQPPLPDVVIPPQELKQMVVKFRDLVSAATKGDRDRIAERNQAREELLIELTMCGQYLQMVAVRRKDLTLLENSGYRVKSKSYTRAAPDRSPETAPIITSVRRGKKPGSVIVNAKSHPGRVSYVLAVCKGDQVDLSSIEILGHFVQCKNEFTGYEPATKLNFLLRYDINGNLSDWSAPYPFIVT